MVPFKGTYYNLEAAQFAPPKLPSPAEHEGDLF